MTVLCIKCSHPKSDHTGRDGACRQTGPGDLACKCYRPEWERK